MHTALLLEMAAGALGDRVATGSLEGGVSYDELAARARAGGHWLSGHDAANVVFVGLNGAALPTALFAAAETGRPFAPLNYRLPDVELRRLLARTAPSLAIVDDDMLARVDGVDGVKFVSRSAFEAATLDPANRDNEHPEPDRDIAVLLFTSG